MSMTQSSTEKTVDVRSVPPPQKHPMIFSAFASLAVVDVENAALAAIHAESLLHDLIHERNDAVFRNGPLASAGRVPRGSEGVVAEQPFWAQF